MNEYPWFLIAKNEMGEAEVPGPLSNARIQEYIDSTTIGGDPNEDDSEIPWCSCFVNWCVEQAGVQGTDSAWARSWLQWGQEADWNALISGSIVVLRRGENSGHVGFFLDANDSQILLLGGNQSDQVSQAWFPLDRVLGIRIPV